MPSMVRCVLVLERKKREGSRPGEDKACFEQAYPGPSTEQQCKMFFSRVVMLSVCLCARGGTTSGRTAYCRGEQDGENNIPTSRSACVSRGFQ